MRLFADECFDARILAGLIRRIGITALTAQDAGLLQTPDEDILSWASEHDHIVLTHDISTMVPLCEGRIRAGLACVGLVAVPDAMPIGSAIEDLVLLLSCYQAADFRDNIVRLPL